MAAVHAIDASELHRRRAAGERHVLLDVRQPEEWALCRLPDAVLIPMAAIPQHLSELPRDRPIYCLCHHGVRSAAVVDLLRERGFDAINVSGGIDAWAVQVDPELPRY